MFYRSLFVLFAFHSKTLDCPFLIYHFRLPIWCLQSFLPPLDQVQDQSYKLDTEYHKSSSDTTIYAYCIYYMLLRCSRKCVYYNSVTTFIFLYYSAQFHAFTYVWFFQEYDIVIGILAFRSLNSIRDTNASFYQGWMNYTALLISGMYFNLNGI